MADRFLGNPANLPVGTRLGPGWSAAGGTREPFPPADRPLRPCSASAYGTCRATVTDAVVVSS